MEEREREILEAELRMAARRYLANWDIRSYADFVDDVDRVMESHGYKWVGRSSVESREEGERFEFWQVHTYRKGDCEVEVLTRVEGMPGLVFKVEAKIKET